ncbi:MAG TPA: ABC transporter permease [Pirellulaceae bacterium]|nr:ABC transporter permease [Pirellulaceae bacterium]
MSSSAARLGRPALPLNELALVLSIVLVFVLTGLIDRNHTYFTNFQASFVIILRNTVLLGIVALGAAVVIIAGGIDLSAGSMIAFSATTCALIMVLLAAPSDRMLLEVGPWGAICGIAGGLIAGLLVGTLHTWLITSIRLPPFVATLATLVGLRSFARAMCEFITRQRWGSQYQQVNVNAPLFIYIKEHLWIATTVFLVLALVTWIILSRTVLGRHIYALGGNEQAARLSGIRTDSVKWFAYCFGALTASIAGIFAMADGSVAQPVNLARGFELNAIAAAVVGGCSLQGGVGTVLGTILGALFLRLVIDAVAKIIKAGADVYEGMIVGIVVVLAVTLTQVRQLLQSGREFFPGLHGALVIPTLAISAGLLAMMGGANVEVLKGRTVWFGVAVGVVTFLLLTAVKLLEMQRRPKTSN